MWDEVLANFPRYRLCKDWVRRLTGGRLKAILALRNGHVRLRDIPQELWAEDATERSAQWLEDQFPTADDVEELHFEWAPHSRETSPVTLILRGWYEARAPPEIVTTSGAKSSPFLAQMAEAGTEDAKPGGDWGEVADGGRSVEWIVELIGWGIALAGCLFVAYFGVHAWTMIQNDDWIINPVFWFMVLPFLFVFGSIPLGMIWVGVEWSIAAVVG